MKLIGVTALISCPDALGGSGSPWAEHVRSYVPGAAPVPGFTDPQTALGSPSRFTPDANFPSVVSVFSPPFLPSQLVSIGEGGSLTVEFDRPIRNDASNPFGVDLIIFGNGGFADDDYPNGRVGNPPFLFGLDNMRVLVSADGQDFRDLGSLVEGFFPAQAFRDGGPYDGSAGQIPTDFTMPMNPALGPGDFAGLTYAQVLTLYNGSGGGTPIDIAPSGLSEVRFVRVEVLDDGIPSTQGNVEIDAFSIVPEPSGLTLLVSLGLLAAFRRG